MVREGSGGRGGGDESDKEVEVENQATVKG